MKIDGLIFKMHDTCISDSAGYYNAFSINQNTGIITALSPVLSTVALIVQVLKLASFMKPF